MKKLLIALCMLVTSCAGVFDGSYGQRSCGHKYSRCYDDRYYDRPSYREREPEERRPSRGAARGRENNRAVDYDVYNEVIYDQEDDGWNDHYTDDNANHNRALDHQKDSDQCLSYGFNPGTMEYSNCQQRLRARRPDTY